MATDETHTRVWAAAGYLGLLTLWIYAYANTTLAEHGDWWLLLPILVGLQLAAGFAVGRWWAVLLPALVVLISVPAGIPEPTADAAEPLPIWFGLMYGAVFAGPLVMLGVAARRIYEQRTRSRSTDLAT